MRLLTLLLCVLTFSALWGQNNDEQLAAQYYASGDYDKAVILYKKIFKDKPNSVYIYENYLNCLLALEEENEAEQLVKKQIKRDKSSMNYKVDLGYVYDHFGHREQAETYFKDLIQEELFDINGIAFLAQSFLKRDYTQQAVVCFEKAIDKHGLRYYWISLMNLYRGTGNYEKATELGLKVLYNDPKSLHNVLYQFSQISEKEEGGEYLLSETMQFAQKYPDHSVFDELLMSLYLQQKKYSAAYKQAKAMDLRNNEDGRRMIGLAEICLSNKAYDVALQCYQLVIDKGQASMFFLDAEIGMLNTLYLKTTDSYISNQTEINTLITKYELFLGSAGYSSATASSMKRLAELYIFYGHHTKKGIHILEKLTVLPRVSHTFIAEVKLLLGDAYLIDDNIWDAKLIYGQVDKEFKEDPLGQEAKFRSARLSYFTGDFDWAREQLEILKTATSQLIANNALDLSLLIQDNTGLDSTEEAMKEYAHAEFLLFQNKTSECMQILNMLPFKYSQHSLTDEVLYLKAKVMEQLGNFEEALNYYAQVYTSYSTDILADDALFKAANIQMNVFNNLEAGKLILEQLILDHTSSLYVVEARKIYEKLKGNALP